jgi:hypothetical protein
MRTTKSKYLRNNPKSRRERERERKQIIAPSQIRLRRGPADLVRSVANQHSPLPQNPVRAFHQADSRLPRRDVHHVYA